MSITDAEMDAVPRCPVVHGRRLTSSSEDYARDPEPWLRRARDEAPVYFEPELDAWFVTRYENILEVLRQPNLFSSKPSMRFREYRRGCARSIRPATRASTRC